MSTPPQLDFNNFKDLEGYAELFRMQAAISLEGRADDVGAPMIHRVSDSTFARDVLLSPEPVLVTFIASDCAPCRTMSSALEEFASEAGDRIKVATLDVDQNPESRARYHVHGLPTWIVFVNGEVAARRIGALQHRDAIETWYESAIGRSP